MAQLEVEVSEIKENVLTWKVHPDTKARLELILAEMKAGRGGRKVTHDEVTLELLRRAASVHSAPPEQPKKEQNRIVCRVKPEFKAAFEQKLIDVARPGESVIEELVQRWLTGEFVLSTDIEAEKEPTADDLEAEMRRMVKDFEKASSTLRRFLDRLERAVAAERLAGRSGEQEKAGAGKTGKRKSKG